MPGIAVDTADTDVSEMLDRIGYTDKFYQGKSVKSISNSGNIGLGIICRQFSQECYMLKESSITGIIIGFIYPANGTVYNDKNEFNKKIISRILQSPGSVLRELNGSFLIVSTDGKKLIVATDKLATQPCFYTFYKGRLILSSEVKGILPLLGRKSINIGGIGDLLAFEFLLGERTLINEVYSIPPAIFIEWENGKIKKEKYRDFNFKYKRFEKDYPRKLLDAYEDSIEYLLKTIDSSRKIGIFLSGGLDSRLLFGVLLKKNVEFFIITYDTNPPGGINPQISRRISDKFGIENIAVDFPHSLADSPELIEDSVWITDGLTPWHFFYNIDFELNHLHRRADIIINNPRQGEFFGEDLSINELTSLHRPVEILRNNERVFRNPVAEETIESLLLGKYSIGNQIQREISRSNRKLNYEILFDVLYNNYYPGFYRKNIAANLVEFRNIFSNVKLLDGISGLPLGLRMRKLPLIKKIPLYPVSPLKLELIKLVNMGLERIPYERTEAAPETGMHIHFMKFAKKSLQKNKNLYDFAKLIREERLKRYIYTDIDNLCDRDLINNDVVYDILDKHMSGKADFDRLLGSLTTASLFIEKAFR